MKKEDYKLLNQTELNEYHISINKKYENFSDYIKDNYVRDFYRTKKYSFNFKNINMTDVEDCFHNCIRKVLEADLKKTKNIENYNAYFWISILNELKNTNKKIEKNITYDLEENQETFELNIYEIFDEYNSFEIIKDDFLDILEKNIKDKLSLIEYIIFKNKFFGNLNGKEMLDLVGYSVTTIYQKNKKINKIIKNELNENRSLYYK